LPVVHGIWNMSTTGNSQRVAVVVGASSGIGDATATLLQAKGISTIRLARRLENSDSTRCCDVRDEYAVKDVFLELASQFGRLDILINCAGIASPASDPLMHEKEEWETIFQTNLFGTYFCCKYAIPIMKRHKYGRIVNLSSIAGRSYSKTASLPYTCSKYGVIGLTRQLAANFGEDGITINCVSPSHTKSEMLLANVSQEQIDSLSTAVPLRRLAEPGEVAQTICFLVSEAASYITGAVVDVNGGQL